jgi:hypothetical protein
MRLLSKCSDGRGLGLNLLKPSVPSFQGQFDLKFVTVALSSHSLAIFF